MTSLLVLDTNVVLDIFVFADEAARPLRPLLEEGRLQWVATAEMREELRRVLEYPQIVGRLEFYGVCAADVMAAFDRHAREVPVAPKAPVTCRDKDDQKFIDVAVAHGGLLLSKDKAVLSMKKRLAALQVEVAKALSASSYSLSKA